MRHAETLYAFAQIAVAFAGFAGLMAFVRGRSSGPLSQVQRNRLIGMVRVALIAVAFAMLPAVMSPLGLSEASTWRLSAIPFAVAFAPTTALAWQRTIALRKAGLSATVPFIPQTATLGLVAIVCSALFSEYSGGLYMAGLFFVLLVSGALFFTLVVTLLEETDQ